MKEVLEVLAKYHNEWLTIVRSFGLCNNYEDIVQEFYLRVYKYKKTNIVQDGKPIKAMCWIMLRNLYFDYHKQESIYVDLPLIELSQQDTYDKDKENKLKHIEDSKKYIHHFDYGILELYSKMSMRKISRETKISLKSICYSVKKSKEKIIETWQEENHKD